jgi:putative endonuclease
MTTLTNGMGEDFRAHTVTPANAGAQLRTLASNAGRPLTQQYGSDRQTVALAHASIGGMKHPCVYMLANHYRGTLYVGVTSDLRIRAWQHRTDAIPGFTSRYGIKTLVWFEEHPDMYSAIQREKRIKEWRRAWKVDLIERSNPEWRDLFPRVSSG